MKTTNTLATLITSSLLSISSFSTSASAPAQGDWLNTEIALEHRLDNIATEIHFEAQVDLEAVHHQIHARGLLQAVWATQQYSQNEEVASIEDTAATAKSPSAVLNKSTVAAITDAAYAGDIAGLKSFAASEAGYSKAYALYRLTTLSFLSGDKPQLLAWLKQAEQALATPKNAEEEVLLAAIIGVMMGVDSSNAMNLIVPYQTLLQKNQTDEFAKARVFLLQGMAAFHTPPAYGGGIESAKALLNQALAAFEYNTQVLNANEQLWGEAESHVWLGKLYWQSGDKVSGQKHFDKALEVNPKMTWVEYFKNSSNI